METTGRNGFPFVISAGCRFQSFTALYRWPVGKDKKLHLEERLPTAKKKSR
jgi:hypothetical protein